MSGMQYANVGSPTVSAARVTQPIEERYRWSGRACRYLVIAGAVIVDIALASLLAHFVVGVLVSGGLSVFASVALAAPMSVLLFARTAFDIMQCWKLGSGTACRRLVEEQIHRGDSA